jgi:hypothetical protein
MKKILSDQDIEDMAGLLRDFFFHTNKTQDTSLSKEERQKHFDSAFNGAGIVQTAINQAMGKSLAYAKCSLDE